MGNGHEDNRIITIEITITEAEDLLHDYVPGRVGNTISQKVKEVKNNERNKC